MIRGAVSWIFSIMATVIAVETIAATVDVPPRPNFSRILLSSMPRLSENLFYCWIDSYWSDTGRFCFGHALASFAGLTCENRVYVSIK